MKADIPEAVNPVNTIALVLPNSGREIILHLSDLHFGWERREDLHAHRKLALDAVLSMAQELDNAWFPTILCITGDIGFQGIESDYQAAEKWITDLCKVLNIPPTDVVLCPGNHDLYRESGWTEFPSESNSADKILGALDSALVNRFSEYEKFCARLGMLPFEMGNNKSYLVGWRKIRKVNFVCLNTAWFSREDDQATLWTGQPHIITMESASQLPSDIQHSKEPFIALAHHPPEWLHHAERTAQNDRPNTIDYLVHRADLLLTGHTHGEIRKPNSIALSGYHLTSGATYGSNRHLNVLRLVRLDDDMMDLRSYKLDPASTSYKWTVVGTDGPYKLPERKLEPPISSCLIQMRLAEATQSEDTQAERDRCKSALAGRFSDLIKKLIALDNVTEEEIDFYRHKFMHRVLGVCTVTAEPHDAPQGKHVNWIVNFDSPNPRFLDLLIQATGERYHTVKWFLKEDFDTQEMNALCKERLNEPNIMRVASSLKVGSEHIPLSWTGNQRHGHIDFQISQVRNPPSPNKQIYKPEDLGAKIQVHSLDAPNKGFRYAHLVLTPRKVIRIFLGEYTRRELVQFFELSI